MAHAESLPDSVLRVVAGQIGSQVRQLASPSLGAAMVGGAQVGQSFPVYMLRRSDLGNTSTDLKLLARRTDDWHHQVLTANSVPLYARSTPLGSRPDDWRVEELVESDIARRIDDASRWVDEHVPNDPEARLLVIPSCYLYAFMLIQQPSTHVVVISMPASYRRLAYERLYESSEFLSLLLLEPLPAGLR